MRRRLIAVAGLALLTALAVGAWLWARQVPMTDRPMEQRAYVWQRQWDEAVRQAVADRGSAFGRLVVLGAEVAFEDGAASVVEVRPDYAALRESATPVGVALRIGPFSGPFDADDAVGQTITRTATDLVERMREHDVAPAELQLDFDAATRHLAGYRVWVEAVREAVSPTPMTITALPSWMRSSDFGPLVRATDAYVLQVHALEVPSGPDAPLALVGPAKTRAWVRQAARYGVPFHVALPTYGYLVAFDEHGRFIGVGAEGPSRDWPEGTLLRELHADAVEMAELVRAWRGSRPMMMQGVIWYRLPTDRDVRNWRWPTLATVMAGEKPAAALAAQAVRRDAGLVDLIVANPGTADAVLADPVRVRWNGDRPLARDVLAGFAWGSRQAGEAELTPPEGGLKLRPGDRLTIAWMRFADDMEVEVDANLSHTNK